MKAHRGTLSALLFALSLLLAPAAPARADSIYVPPTAISQALSATPEEGDWLLSLQGGYPWQRARVTYGLTPRRLSIFAEAESALFVRSQYGVGVARPWVNRGAWQLGGEAMVGYLRQTGELAQRGPTAALHLRVSRTQGIALPYLMLGSRHLILATHIVTYSAEGRDLSHAFDHRWTPEGTAGVGFRLSERLGLDVGLDWPYIDASQLTLPGIHLGVHGRIGQ